MPRGQVLRNGTTRPIRSRRESRADRTMVSTIVWRLAPCGREPTLPLGRSLGQASCTGGVTCASSNQVPAFGCLKLLGIEPNGRLDNGGCASRAPRIFRKGLLREAIVIRERDIYPYDRGTPRHGTEDTPNGTQ